MGEILSSIGAVATGGITGIIGAGVQRFADYKNKKLDIELLGKQMAHEVVLVEKGLTAQTRVAELDTEKARDVADAASFAASMAEPARATAGQALTQRQSSWMVALDFVRGIVRPGLTLYLVVLTTLIYFHANSLLTGSAFTPADALDLTKRTVDTVLYLTTTATLWYFGVRNKQPGPKLK